MRLFCGNLEEGLKTNALLSDVQLMTNCDSSSTEWVALTLT